MHLTLAAAAIHSRGAKARLPYLDRFQHSRPISVSTGVAKSLPQLITAKELRLLNRKAARRVPTGATAASGTNPSFPRTYHGPARCVCYIIPQIKAISFDGDNTLWDSKKVMRNSLAHVLSLPQARTGGAVSKHAQRPEQPISLCPLDSLHRLLRSPPTQAL